jgi:hypothetical protein
MASPNLDKITPTDSRVQHCTYAIPGSPHNKTYHYLLANPPSGTKPVATALLVHGFPDLSFGWRYRMSTQLQAAHPLFFSVKVVSGESQSTWPPPQPPNHHHHPRIFGNRTNDTI